MSVPRAGSLPEAADVVVVAALPLTVRRSWPIVAVAACAGATTLYLLAGIIDARP